MHSQHILEITGLLTVAQITGVAVRHVGDVVAGTLDCILELSGDLAFAVIGEHPRGNLFEGRPLGDFSDSIRSKKPAPATALHVHDPEGTPV